MRRTKRIAALNDQLRAQHTGGAVVITKGVQNLGVAAVADVVAAVAEFDQFSDDNDPYGEHDCAVLTVAEHRVIWKIDYYDKTMTCSSPDPADPTQTVRVLTIMLAEEY